MVKPAKELAATGTALKDRKCLESTNNKKKVLPKHEKLSSKQPQTLNFPSLDPRNTPAKCDVDWMQLQIRKYLYYLVSFMPFPILYLHLNACTFPNAHTSLLCQHPFNVY